MKWSDISPDIKHAIYIRRYKKGEDVSALATEFEINPVTLNRRLQEYRMAMEDPSSDTDEQEKMSVKGVDQNNMVISARSDRITSLDELLAGCKVDLNVWEVEHWIANTWEGYRKAETRSLSWESGRIESGQIEDTGGITTATLYQIKAWLVRKQPIAIEPMITPVTLSPIPFRVTNHNQFDIQKTLIIPDVQIGFRYNAKRQLVPFHDRLALSLVLQLVERITFDNIVILGDFLDLPDWSDKFIREPDFQQLTQPAIEEAAWILWQLRSKQPGARIAYLEGNHEERLRDSIAKRLPEAYHLRPAGLDIDYKAWSIPHLLGLEEMGIEWVGDYPDGVVWLGDNLRAIHGMSLSAEKMVNNTDVSTIFGHIHRYDASSRAIHTRYGPRTVTAYCPGFLGKLDGSVPGVKAEQRWTQGMGIIHHAGNDEPSVEHLPISNGRMLFGGSVYEGEDYTNALNELGTAWRF